MKNEKESALKNSEILPDIQPAETPNIEPEEQVAEKLEEKLP